MKFEDLKVGMVLKRCNDENHYRVTAIGETSFLFVKGNNELEGFDRFFDLHKYEQFKYKKRYWRWDIRHIPTNSIGKSSDYMDEEKRKTNGEAHELSQFFDLIKKYEDDFYEE